MTTKHPNVGCLPQNWEPGFPSWLKLGMIGTPDWGDRVGLGLSRKKRKLSRMLVGVFLRKLDQVQ